MKYRLYHEIEAPIDDLIELTFDREERDPKVYPNVTKSRYLKKERNDKTFKFTLETVANGDIPERARKLIKPKMLTWHEFGEFDFEKSQYNYHVKTLYFTNVFKMKGQVNWKKLSDTRTGREMLVEISINIPLLGGFIEKKIAQTQKENLDLDVNRMPKEVAEMKAKQAGKK